MPTSLIMSCGTRKMPLPMTVPTTIATAAHTPSTRRSPGAVGSVMLLHLSRPQTATHASPTPNGHGGADQHVPGPGDRGLEPDVSHHQQARPPCPRSPPARPRACVSTPSRKRPAARRRGSTRCDSPASSTDLTERARMPMASSTPPQPTVAKRASRKYQASERSVPDRAASGL